MGWGKKRKRRLPSYAIEAHHKPTTSYEEIHAIEYGMLPIEVVYLLRYIFEVVIR